MRTLKQTATGKLNPKGKDDWADDAETKKKKADKKEKGKYNEKNNES